MTLYIGAVFGGPEFSGSDAKRLIGSASRIAQKNDVFDQGALDIVFHIPGNVIKPDWKGARTGRISRKRKMLQIQIAVPESIVNNASKLKEFIIKEVKEAILLGAPVLERSKIPFSSEDHMEIVNALQEDLMD